MKSRNAWEMGVVERALAEAGVEVFRGASDIVLVWHLAWGSAFIHRSAFPHQSIRWV